MKIHYFLFRLIAHQHTSKTTQNKMKKINPKTNIAFIFLSLLIQTTCHAQTAKWLKVPKVRNGTDSNIVSEITNRLPNTSIMNGEDTVGRGHYGGHGINAYLRQKYGRGTNVDNASYMPGGFAFIAPEPSQFTLTDVVRQTNAPMPAGNLAIPHWNRQPLYILDELSAYTCGTLSGIQAGQSHTTRTRFSYKCAKDLLAHAKTMVRLSKERGYSEAKALEWYVKHVEKLHRDIIEKHM
jgi:hypothetical protein